MASSDAIAVASDAPGPQLPWIFRVVVALPASPWLAAGLFAALHVAVAAAVMHFASFSPEVAEREFAARQLYSFFFALVPISAVMLLRGAQRDVDALAPVLGLDARSLPGVRDELLSVTPRAMRRAIAGGLLLAAVTLLVFGVFGGRATRETVWVFVVPREFLIDVLIFGVLGWGIAVSVRTARLFAERAEFSLLDAEAPAPVVRTGLRAALWWLVYFAISLPIIPLFSQEQSLLVTSVALIGSGLALSLAVLYLPLGELRRRIRGEKQREIAEVRRQIHEARAARQEDRLPGLLAWEARIASVPEWPMSAGALGRLGLYLLIPLGSWVGGALVERAVDSALR